MQVVIIDQIDKNCVLDRIQIDDLDDYQSLAQVMQMFHDMGATPVAFRVG